MLPGHTDRRSVHFLLVGHTKFGADLVAQSNAGHWKSRDTFKHPMLNQHIRAYACVSQYEGNFLQSWIIATPFLLRQSNVIMNYRFFKFFATKILLT